MITVVNKYKTNSGESIMRPSVLGNPFSHMLGTRAEFQVLTREEAIRKYREWIMYKIRLKDPKILGELNRLAKLALKGDLELRCCCAPKACHGDVLKEVLEAALKGS